MKVKRTIEDYEFSDKHIEELEKKIKKQLIDEKGDFTDSEIKKRLKEKCLEIAKDSTLYEQGDNCLHRKIEYEIVD